MLAYFSMGVARQSGAELLRPLLVCLILKMSVVNGEQLSHNFMNGEQSYLPSASLLFD